MYDFEKINKMKKSYLYNIGENKEDGIIVGMVIIEIISANIDWLYLKTVFMIKTENMLLGLMIKL